MACLLGHYWTSMKKDISALSVDIGRIKTGDKIVWVAVLLQFSIDIDNSLGLDVGLIFKYIDYSTY